ncbi:hypothetical protein [Nostoc sp.]|uniref:hypothetical protein n=1 Tax=Nostoc sp. TaxID=1180 RepID=UPI002FF47EE5
MFPLFLIGEVILSGGIAKVVASIKSQCQTSQWFVESLQKLDLIQTLFESAQ